MVESANRERDLFLAVLQQETSAGQAEFLDRACGDGELRRRVEALLRAHGQPDSLLDQPAVGLDAGEDTVAAVRADGADSLPAGLAPGQEPGSVGRLDHYEVLEVVGRGGMGVVLRARDTKLQRIVALKVLAPRLAANAAARQRILREAQAAAAVCHHHVVGIHAVQKDGPLPYLVMEFVGGTTLEEQVRQEGALPVKEVLRIGMQIARGLAVAHAQGLVHRDIKPSNILLENGVQRVKITDFGLARAGDDFRVTQAGTIAGTPQYMAPEQARGEAVDLRADLFSLGSVLYTLCTGSPPFRATNPLQVLRQVCDDRPQPIHALNSDMPPAVCAVVERLHAKDPAQRYQTATEVADVLAGLLAELQQPNPQVRSAPAGSAPRPSRSRRWMTATALVPLVALAVLVPPWLQPPTADAPSMAPAVARPEQPPATLDARRRADIPSDLLALAGGGDPAQAPAELVAVLGSPRPQHAGIVDDLLFADGDNLVTADWTGTLAWWDAASGKLRRRLPHIHAKWIRGLALSPDGTRIATGGTDGATSSAGRVQLWDAHSGEHLQTIPVPLHVLSLAFSPDGKWLAVGSGNNALADSPLGKLLATGGSNAPFAGRIAVLDTQTGKQVHNFAASTHHWIQQMAFSPDSRLLAVAGHDRRVRLFDPATGSEVRSWEAHDAPIDRLAFHPNGSILATGSDDRTVRLWDVATGTNVHTFAAQRGVINALRFSPDGEWLAAADTEGDVVLWDAASYVQRFVRGGHSWHNALAFHTGDHTLAAVDAGNGVRRWQIPDGQERRPGPGHAGAVHAVAVSRDGRLLASGGADGTAQVWDLAAWKPGAAQPPVRVLAGHGAEVRSLAFSADGALLATGSLDRTIALWDPRSGRLIRKLKDHSAERSVVAFSCDSTTLAAGGADGTVRRWQVATGQDQAPWPGHTGIVRAVAFSPDGRQLASAGMDGTVQLRDAATGRIVRTFRAQAPCVNVAFSPDGAALAAVTDRPAGRLLVWDVASGHAESLAGHALSPIALAFHPRGHYVATGGYDGTIRIWDQRPSGVRVRLLGPGPFGTCVAALACTPDGHHVASANANGTVTILRIAVTAGAAYPARGAGVPIAARP